MNMQVPPHGQPPAPPPPLDDGRPDNTSVDRQQSFAKRERRTSGSESVKGERERRRSGSDRDRKPSFGKRGKLPKQ